MIQNMRADEDAKSLETAMENLDIEDSEPEVKPAKKEIEEDKSVPVEEAPKEEKGGKKKKRKKGKKDDEDEDLDAMLAASKSEYTGEAPPEETEAPKAPLNEEKTQRVSEIPFD